MSHEQEREMKKHLHEIKEEYERESIHHKQHHGWWMHSIRIIIGIICLALIISYFTFGERGYHVLEGRLVSDEIDPSYTISIRDNLSVELLPLVYEGMLAVLESGEGDEVSICLLGTIQQEGKKSTYAVTGYYVPRVFSSSAVHVNHARCNESTIIDLHSHPTGSCLFSKQDVESYRDAQAANKQLMMGLMCSRTRFAFFKE